MSFASSSWVWILIVGLILLFIFLAIYWRKREGEVGSWSWGLLFLALFVILLAFILQLVLGKNSVPPMGEVVYHHPGWIQQSEGAPLVPGQEFKCPPYFSKGLRLAPPSQYSLLNPTINRIMYEGSTATFTL